MMSLLFSMLTLSLGDFTQLSSADLTLKLDHLGEHVEVDVMILSPACLAPGQRDAIEFLIKD